MGSGATDYAVEIARAIRDRERFLITSHARPDGDSIGSQLAMALALRALGKTVRIVNRDPAPFPYSELPGVAGIEIVTEAVDAADACIVLECSDLARTGITGLERYFVMNIDHHPGNQDFGSINWFDSRAAACGEMVFEIIQALGVSLSVDMATHLYVAIVTDTGSFRYPSVTERTFEIAHRLVLAGASPAGIASTLFDNNSLSRLRLVAAILNTLRIEADGRLAVIQLTRDMLTAAGATGEETEGIINMPLMVRDIELVIFIRQGDEGTYRISLRSKGEIDVGAVAKSFGGGGHKNASGVILQGRFEEVRGRIVARAREALRPKEKGTGVFSA